MKAIYDAFAAHVTALGAELGLPVAYPGVGFEPPSAGAWLELAWFPNETQNYGVADDGPSLLQGFGQVQVCYRPGTGILDGLGLADRVIAWFAKGTELAGVRVYRKPSVSSVLETPQRIAHPVTVWWRGFDR